MQQCTDLKQNTSFSENFLIKFYISIFDKAQENHYFRGVLFYFNEKHRYSIIFVCLFVCQGWFYFDSDGRRYSEKPLESLWYCLLGN